LARPGSTSSFNKLSIAHPDVSIGGAAEKLWDSAYETDQVAAPIAGSLNEHLILPLAGPYCSIATGYSKITA
jgi:hypothetical protein